jgi:hypothetical protein
MAIYLYSGAHLPRLGLQFHWSLRRYSLSLCRPDVPRLTRLSFPRINVRTTAHERQHMRIDCMQISLADHNNESSSLCQGAAPKGQPGMLRNRCLCCSASQIKLLPWSSFSQPGCTITVAIDSQDLPLLTMNGHLLAMNHHQVCFNQPGPTMAKDSWFRS